MHLRSNWMALAVAVSFLLATTSVAIAQVATTTVAFAKGKSSAAVSGTLKGDQIRDYVVRANAGQTMKVTLTGSPIVFFNVLPPGSNDEAIFVGSSDGSTFSGTLGASGAYKVRVYQMRATARTGKAGSYAVTIGVTGGASAPPRPPAGGLRGIAGMGSIDAIDAMSNRGFANVDSLESGNTQYGIFYNRATRTCAQLTMADGKVLDARDIKTHPKCR